MDFPENDIAVKTVELDMSFQAKIRERFPVIKDIDSFHIEY